MKFTLFFFVICFRVTKKKNHLKVRSRVCPNNSFLLWSLKFEFETCYTLHWRYLFSCCYTANFCRGWYFSSTGIYLTFKVTGDVPVTHVAANTDSTVPSPAVVTISCNQCFSVNKWITSGKGLAFSAAHDSIFCSISIIAPPGWDASSRTPPPELCQVAMTIGRNSFILLGGEALSE